jgi:Tfp pilus assembly protein PilN
MKLNLNLATSPLENRRRFLAGAGAVGLVAVIALVFLGQHARRDWQANRQLRSDISRIEKEISGYEDQQAELARYFEMPAAKQVLDRSNFLNVLIHERTFPWPKIFEDLEHTLPAGVRIVSIAPTLQGGRAQVRLTFAAMDDESKVKFLRALESSRVFTEIRVSDEKYPDATQERTLSNDRVYVTLEAWYATI